MGSPANDVLLIGVVLVGAFLFCVVVAASVFMVAVMARERRVLRRMNRKEPTDGEE